MQARGIESNIYMVRSKASWLYLVRPKSTTSTTLLSEVKVGSQLTTLVVTPQHHHLFRPHQLHGQDQEKHFDGKGSPVHVVS